jgi:hypothetical protein
MPIAQPGRPVDADLEREIRHRFDEARLPAAPEGIRAFIADLPTVRPAARTKPHWAVVAIPLLVAGLVLTAKLAPSAAPGPTTGSATEATSIPSAGEATQQAAASLPTEVDGLPVRSVSSILAARENGEAQGGPFALGGFWSVRTAGFDCRSPYQSGAGDLEVFCEDGLYGITELNEPMLTAYVSGLGEPSATLASGPNLTPWVASPQDHDRLWALPTAAWTPVPIVVVGHFDDPLSEKCRPEARQKCVDRFVIDRIVAFEPSAVPAPETAAPPTPFPLNDPPPPTFPEETCYPEAEKSFVGWVKVGSLGIPLKPEWGPETFVYAMVTEDVVPIAEPSGAWIENDRIPGHKIRWWGRHVCFAERPGALLHGGNIIGTTYIEVDDGRRIDSPYPYG